MNNENNPASQKPTDSIGNYIQGQLSTGLQPNEIAAQLRTAGWSEEQIQQAFQKVQAQVMPTPPPDENAPVDSQAPAVLQASPHVAQPIQTDAKRGRTKTGWILFKQSLQIIKSDKGLTRYITVSIALSLLLFIIFAVVFVLGHNLFLTNTHNNNSQNVALKPLGILAAFVYYVLAFFITNLYTAGLTANVLDLFHGKSKPYKEYMKIARSKGLTLFIYAVIEATVGMILRAIAERSKLFGKIIIWIVGALWSVARLFAIPVIMTTNENAVSAIKDSTILVKKTWGENIVGRTSFGLGVFLIYLVILIPGTIGLLLIGTIIGGAVGAIIASALLIIIFIAFSIVVSAASSVLNTALFYYAQYNQIPAAFSADLINKSFKYR
jgi:hypothetical protein